MFKYFCLFTLVLLTQEANAFCGFYVARADASLYNQASQVVMVRKEDKTVLSMMNDFKGDLEDFALVVPVPEVLKKGQVHIGDAAIFKHLDQYTAPRLVEYHDADPCRPMILYEKGIAMMKSAAQDSADKPGGRSLGVTIEAQYTVGEYDIVILSATESNGLETWLLNNGYKIPKGAAKILKPYIKQGFNFFVAKVNLKEQAKTGQQYLRPIQFAFQSEKFMLPIRLGMINANGPQDLLIYILTANGRVETTNYQNVKMPSNIDLPVYIKQDFADFYKALFDKQVEKYRMRTVFTEYFWNMGWCDPCAADPLTTRELKQLGVFWLNQPMPLQQTGIPMPIRRGGMPVLVTRLHVRYRQETFPEDLMFQETRDRRNFQGRYVLHHPWKGDPDSCPAAREYFARLSQRQQKEAENLALLTGWDLQTIMEKMQLQPVKKQDENWWENLWQ